MALAEARFLAMERCVEAANELMCEIFVIAGDLLDRQNVSSADIRKAADMLSTFTGDVILLLPGNHDFFAGADSRPTPGSRTGG